MLIPFRPQNRWLFCLFYNFAFSTNIAHIFVGFEKICWRILWCVLIDSPFAHPPCEPLIVYDLDFTYFYFPRCSSPLSLQVFVPIYDELLFRCWLELGVSFVPCFMFLVVCLWMVPRIVVFVLKEKNKVRKPGRRTCTFLYLFDTVPQGVGWEVTRLALATWLSQFCFNFGSMLIVLWTLPAPCSFIFAQKGRPLRWPHKYGH